MWKDTTLATPVSFGRPIDVSIRTLCTVYHCDCDWPIGHLFAFRNRQSRISRTCYLLCILDRRRPTRFIIRRKRVFFTADRHFGLIIGRLGTRHINVSPRDAIYKLFHRPIIERSLPAVVRAHEYYERNK